MYIHAGMWKAFVTVLSTVGPLCIAVLLAENIQRTPFFCTPSRRYPPPYHHTHASHLPALSYISPFPLFLPATCTSTRPRTRRSSTRSSCGSSRTSTTSTASAPTRYTQGNGQVQCGVEMRCGNAVWKCGVECNAEGCRFICHTLCWSISVISSSSFLHIYSGLPTSV